MKLSNIKRNKKLLKMVNKRLDKQITILNSSIVIGFSDTFKIIFEKNDKK